MGDIATELYIVISGTVKHAIVSPEGHERVVAIISAGQSVGEAELFSLQRYTAEATALEPSTILCIDYTSLRLCVKQDPALGLRIIGMMAQRQLDTNADIANSLIESVNDRVLDFLLRHSGGANAIGLDGETCVTLLLPASKKVIAARIGITPETLSRTFRELSELSLIKVERNLLTLNLTNIDARAKRSQSGWKPPTWSRDRRRAGGWSMRPAQHVVTLKVLNKAGLTRMLSQRVARSWLMLERGIFPEQARDNFQRSVALFERYLYDLSVALPEGAPRSAYVELNHQWRVLRKALGEAVSDKSEAQLLELSDYVLHASEKLTEALTSELDSQSAYYLDHAGRLRMLSQCIAKLFLLRDLQSGCPVTAEKMHHARKEFDAHFARIQTQLPPEYPDIAIGLNKVSQHWAFLQDALDSATPEQFQIKATAVIQRSDSILEGIDRSLQFLQRKSP